MDGRIDRLIEMIEGGMDLTVSRRRLIASNVANAETPKYRAVDVDFERYLRDAQGAGARLARVSMIRSHDRHLQPLVMAPHLPLRWRLEPLGELRADGNTVDLEQEMAKMAENQVRFEALADALNRVFSLLEEAATEGGRR